MFYLGLGTPMPNFRFLNLISVDLIRPSLVRKYFLNFFLNPFGPLSKMGVQFRKYVVKDHGFPFLKWCDTSQSVQQFGC